MNRWSLDKVTDDFHDAWRDLKEKYLRLIAKRHLGVTLREFEDRKLVESGSLAAAVQTIRRRNLFRITWLRLRRAVQVKMQ